jgi:hypothetical protein
MPASPKLFLSWAIVVAPLAWGIYHTILNALKLFS